MNIFKYCFSGLIPIFFYSMISCTGVMKCPEREQLGNPGSVINTGNNDYLPVIYKGRLYFISIREDDNKKERLFLSEIRGTEFGKPVRDSILPLDNFSDYGSPSFFFDSASGTTEMYFAAIKPHTNTDRDIFISVNKGDGWSKPEVLPSTVNTVYYESHPFISADGRILLFSSDRPGSIGETDIYISRRLNDGNWQESENLGAAFNTAGREISPYIDSHGFLYYATNGFGSGSNLDIFRAEPNTGGVWQNPKMLPFPVNTDADEYGTAVYDNNIVLSSNRIGGCGAFDIYSFKLCGPVLLSGTVESERGLLPLKGEVRLSEIYGNLIYSKEIDADSTFEFKIEPYHRYVLSYKNDCLPEFPVVKEIETPCSDSSSVRIEAKIIIPENIGEFLFEQYKVPFFVTGYYMPNTAENLEALKLKFSYGLLGNSDSTRYIENPEAKYDGYIPIIEEAFGDATEFIINKLKYLGEKCLRGNPGIKIVLTGFTDPRAISPLSRYLGPDIDDGKFNLYVKSGSQIDNELLSQLRAYFTAKLLQSVLMKYDEYSGNLDRIKWVISGKGADTDESLPLEARRRVIINISLESNSE